MAITTVTKDNFQAEVLDSNIPVLVDFWAPWCGPCRMMGPIVDEVEEGAAGKYRVGKVNIDEQPELSEQYHVASIPTLVVFEGGKVKETAVGTRSKSDILKMLSE